MARLILVEDDPASAQIMERMLTRIGGHTVRVLLDPRHIFDAVRQGEVDLIVMDVALTGSWLDDQRLDGLELARRLKSGAYGPPPPVILVTANAMRGDRERLLAQSGADGYMAKPILDYRALCELIGEHLAADAANPHDSA